MITLLAALLLASPQPRQLWEREILCWPGGVCGPRVVNLGGWDPAPAPKDWSDNAPLSAPKVWAPGETGI